jgi:hypothetical protein
MSKSSMKKIFNFIYNIFYKTTNLPHTEIRFTFNEQTNNPNVTLHLSDLNDKTADELARIFYIFQTGAAQQFLIDKISHISTESNTLFLENVYDSFNKLDFKNNNKKNSKYPMIRPLAVFNNASNN